MFRQRLIPGGQRVWRSWNNRLLSTQAAVKPSLLVYDPKDNMNDTFEVSDAQKSFVFQSKDSVARLKKEFNADILDGAQNRIADSVLVADLLVRPAPGVAFEINSEDTCVKVETVLPSDFLEDVVVSSPEKLEKRRKFIEDKLASLTQEFSDACVTYDGVEEQVHRDIRRRGWMIATWLVFQNLGLSYLTWVQYSWDVMEPVCYFIGASVASWGALYYSWLKTENSYENLWQRMENKRRKQIYNSLNFDAKRLKEMKAEIDCLKVNLDTVKNHL